MSNEFLSTCQFVSCTTLDDFRDITNVYYKKIKLDWSFPLDVLFSTYTKIEIYRYISNELESSNIDDITVDDSKLVYSLKQNKTNVVREQFSPNYTQETTTGNISSYLTFTDDFRSLINTGNELYIFHSLNGSTQNSDIINDIIKQRRHIRYFIKGYTNNANSELAPYILITNYKGPVTCHSSKTQVKHNYLHYEGDEIWSNSTAGTSMSRMTIDISGIYNKNEHKGSYGRGGTVWVSEQNGNRVYQYNLRNGSLYNIYTDFRGSEGHGIAIHKDTNNCISGPSNRLYYLNGDEKNVKNLNTTTANSKNFVIVPICNYSDRFFIADKASNGTIIKIGKDLSIQKWRTSNFVVNGYGAAATPSGWSVQVASPYRINFAHPERTLDANTIDSGVYYNGELSQINKICADNYIQYPNTIVNTANSPEIYCLALGGEICLQTSLSVQGSAIGDPNFGFKEYWHYDYSPCQVPSKASGGFDGENNLWHVGDRYKLKVYRTAGYRSVSGDNEFTYPFGGYSRYPAASLYQWPTSPTNETEIEWFLTRNNGIITYRRDINKFNQTIDSSSMDNSTSVYWDPARPAVNQAARTAWNAMIERKMFRVSNYTNPPYFKVYNANNQAEPSAKRWGIRMNVLDIRDTYMPGVDLDYFYEYHSSIWMPIIKKRIQSWSNAFANDVYSYINLDNATRTLLINGNKRGILVHPFYQYTTKLKTNTKYINTALIDDTQNRAISAYIDQIRFYNFDSRLATEVNMYADFTGTTNTNIQNLYKTELDDIVPERITTSVDNIGVTLQISGFQLNNTELPDANSPQCYPWYNQTTYPFTSSLTGYDDFAITFLVSANAYDFTIDNFTLYTDDYDNNRSDTDTDNKATIITNISGNSAIINYTYNSPSLEGINKIPNVLKPNGYFNPYVAANITIIDNETGEVTTKVLSADARVFVLEREPEARIFIDENENKYFRQNFFTNNTWGRNTCPDSISIYEELSASVCPASYDGYTLYSREVSSNYLGTTAGTWSLKEGYCYLTLDREFSAVPWDGCIPPNEGIAIYFRDSRHSYFNDLTTSTPWMLSATLCYSPCIYTETIITTGIPGNLPWYECAEELTRSKYVSHLYNLTSYGNWSVSSVCYSPFITLLTAVCACPVLMGSQSNMTMEQNKYITYFTGITGYSDWRVSTHSDCTADIRIVFSNESSPYTNNITNFKYWRTDVDNWVNNINSISPFTGYIYGDTRYSDSDLYPKNYFASNSIYSTVVDNMIIRHMKNPSNKASSTVYVSQLIEDIKSDLGDDIWDRMRVNGKSVKVYIDVSGSMASSIQTQEQGYVRDLLRKSVNAYGVSYTETTFSSEKWLGVLMS